MKRTQMWSALLGAAVWGVSPAFGMNLMQAYEAALEQDANYAAARAATDAARERIPMAQSQLLPNINLGVSQTRNDLRSTAPNFLGQSSTTDSNYNSYNQSLSLRQPLYRKVQTVAVNQAEYSVADAENVLTVERQNVGVKVAGAYFEFLLAQDTLAMVTRQQAMAEQKVVAAQRLFESGSGIKTDIDELSAKVAEAKAQVLKAKQQVNLTRRQLEVLINTAVDAVDALDAAKLDVKPPTDELDVWVVHALANSPEVQALTARVEAARMEVEKAQAGHLPTLDLVAQVTRSGSENVQSPNSSYYNKSIGVQLNVPIYSGGYISAQNRQAQAAYVQAQAQLEALKRDLSVRVHREYHGMTEGVAQVQALEASLSAAQQVVYSSKRAMEAGSRTLLDVLNAEQRMHEITRDLSQARYAYIVAAVRLSSLTGTDPVDSLQTWSNVLSESVQ